MAKMPHSFNLKWWYTNTYNDHIEMVTAYRKIKRDRDGKRGMTTTKESPSCIEPKSNRNWNAQKKFAWEWKQAEPSVGAYAENNTLKENTREDCDDTEKEEEDDGDDDVDGERKKGAPDDPR